MVNRYYNPARGRFTTPDTRIPMSSYDTLGRLTSANSQSATGDLAWGQSFVYDPFGNLLQQNVTSGSAPAMNLTVDPNTNRITSSGFVYDAAGNLIQSPSRTYSHDSENRMVGAGGQRYFYGASGELLFKTTSGSTSTYIGPANGTMYLYGPDGTRLGKGTA